MHRDFPARVTSLSDNGNDTTVLLDLGLGPTGNVTSLDDDGVSGETTFGENFAVTVSEAVDDGYNSRGSIETLSLFSGDEGLESKKGEICEFSNSSKRLKGNGNLQRSCRR